MDAMKLHKRPHLMHNVDDTGPKLTYNSGNRKLLAVKGSTCIHKATHGEKGETVAIVFCLSASGSNWILPMVLCKDKYRKV
jgi:hypothetical protein